MRSKSISVRRKMRSRANSTTRSKFSLTWPPVEGHANEACIEFFAKLLKLPHGSVTIASGQPRRGKVIRVSELSAEELRSKMGLINR